MGRGARPPSPRAAALASALAAGLVLALAIPPALAHGRRRRSRPGRPAVTAGPLAGRGALAFVSLGRLYVLDGSNGRLALLAGADAHPSDPRFSPDGRWLSWQLGDGDVGVARADGSNPRTIQAQGADGRWLADSVLLIGQQTYRPLASAAPTEVGQVPRRLVAWSAARSHRRRRRPEPLRMDDEVGRDLQHRAGGLLTTAHDLRRPSLSTRRAPRGSELALVEAVSETATDFYPATVTRWYATRHLWLVQTRREARDRGPAQPRSGRDHLVAQRLEPPLRRR